MAGDGNKYWVEVNTKKGPTRIGPYKDPARAGLRHKLEIQAWKESGGKGVKPQLTSVPTDWVPTRNVTSETYRESPRTGRISKNPSLPNAKQNGVKAGPAPRQV